MTREEIKARFRFENPEITTRVLAETTLNSWLIQGDKEFCAKTRCIADDGTDITAVVGQDTYDLLASIPKFFDINEFPGGGVAYDGERIDKKTKAQLDNEHRSWRSNSNGIPNSYYRRGKNIIFNCPCSAAETITVDSVLVSDDFDDDDKEPYNELSYLEPYHYAMVLYLQGRAKMTVSKDQQKMLAMQEYDQFVAWAIKELGGDKFAKLRIIPSKAYIPNRRRR